MNTARRVVAAIDFGTHGVGFAWAPVTAENDDLHRREVVYFDQWEDQPVAWLKNLSALLLDEHGELVAWGYRAHELWAAAPSAHRYVAGFKMSLQRNVGDSPSAGGASGVTVADDVDDVRALVTLCLRQVHTKAVEQIIRTGAYRADDVHWCVTVPAIWDSYTRDVMRAAAVDAGMPGDRLELVAEPKAAALYCLAKGAARLAVPGTGFLVIDAGGGTVDLSAYEVQKDGSLGELTVPGGDKAGSEYLNKEFVNRILIDRFGADFVGRMLGTEPRAMGELVNAWERQKRWIRPTDDEVAVPLNARLYRRLVDDVAALDRIAKRQDGVEDAVAMTADEIRLLFDAVLDRMIECTDRQLRAMRDKTGSTGGEVALLVGGFSESALLQARLRSFLASRNVELYVPERPSIAVVTGAVHFVYDPSVFTVSRSPLTYGVETWQAFRSGHDPENLKDHDGRGNELCRHRFDVFIEKGGPVRPGTSVKKMYMPTRETQETISLKLFSANHADPEYTFENGVEPVGLVHIDMTPSLQLPMSKRTAEVALVFGTDEIRVVGRDPNTGAQVTADIEWRPTW